MELKVPKSFQIFGKTIKVTQPHKVDKEDSRGEWSYNKATIKVKRSLPTDEKESVFLHELTHCILEMLEYNELSHNEQLVETFSRALQQALKTMK